MTLLKTYEEILRNPAAYKKNIYKILEDLDRRINDNTEHEMYYRIFARKDHNHDKRYARRHHLHNEYASKNHFHDQYLNKESTAKNSEQLGGVSADKYSQKGHYHKDMVYVAKFTINSLDKEGRLKVNLHFNIYPENCYFMTPVEGLTLNVVDCIGSTAIVEYTYTGEHTGIKTYAHIFYWSTEPFDETEKTPTNIYVRDVYGERGGSVNLYAIVNDDNNNDVNKGLVTFEKDKEPEGD